MHERLRIAAAATAVLAASCAATQERDPALIAGWGVAGVLDQESVDGIGVEYRHSPVVWNLQPMIGFSGSAAEDTSYTFAGVHYPIDMGERWRLSPSLAAGYFDPGGGLSLGGQLEFRSGIEVNYLLSKEWRVGVAFTHLSNGGLYDFNPGTEAVSLSLHYLF